MIGLEYIVIRHGMKMNEVAEQIGVTKQSFSDWCKGKRKIPRDRFIQLSRLLHIRAELLNKEEANFNEIDRLEVDYAVFRKRKDFDSASKILKLISEKKNLIDIKFKYFISYSLENGQISNMVGCFTLNQSKELAEMIANSYKAMDCEVDCVEILNSEGVAIETIIGRGEQSQ
ncbi:helix-turn-helix domain-containing protein [Lysinibacillus xylanilyticus]|uniref:helix-turn-helix domain-containing protein n=1 Tax=Lysinibacillus xylanilyticus TaxID=582475 RepID=UPI00382AF496